MFPFEPDPNWYERHWLSPVPVKLPWRIPAMLMSLASCFWRCGSVRMASRQTGMRHLLRGAHRPSRRVW
jgi:hypothetical protein